MTAVARVLLRDWDGRRLLRFLTGLAMLALAFTSPLTAAPVEPPTPVAPAPVTVPAPVVTGVTQDETVAAVGLVTDEPMVLPAAPASSPVLAASIVLLAGLALRARSVRGPPLR